MKINQVIATITLIVMVLSISLVSALEQNEASVQTFMSETPKVRGEETSIRVQFTSKTDETLSIYYVGIHVDWMDTDQLYGIDYSSNPKTVAAGKSLNVDIINYTVPASASYGAHTYYIGVDGYDQDGDPFSWTSDEATIYVGSPQSTNEPTSNLTPTATQNPQNMDYALLIYGGLIVAAVVVIVLIVILKKRSPNTKAKSKDNPTVPPKPEQKPDDAPGQDFNI